MWTNRIITLTVVVSESKEDTTPPGYIPPTPPRPRRDAGAYRLILDEDVEVDFTEYFTDSED